MMTGVFWPLESLSNWLQNIFWSIPLSIPIRSIQLIQKRGWALDQHEVLDGFYISLGYNALFFMANVIIYKFTSK